MNNTKIHYMPIKGYVVWNDIKSFLLSQIEKLPLDKEGVFTATYDELYEMLNIHFNSKYNSSDIIQLLKNGFEVKEDYFEFKKDDFIRPAAQL